MFHLLSRSPLREDLLCSKRTKINHVASPVLHVAWHTSLPHRTGSQPPTRMNFPPCSGLSQRLAVCAVGLYVIWKRIRGNIPTFCGIFREDRGKIIARAYFCYVAGFKFYSPTRSIQGPTERKRVPRPLRKRRVFANFGVPSELDPAQVEFLLSGTFFLSLTTCRARFLEST